MEYLYEYYNLQNGKKLNCKEVKHKRKISQNTILKEAEDRQFMSIFAIGTWIDGQQLY